MRDKQSPKFIIIRRIIIAFIEGSIIEITLLSMSKFIQVTSSNTSGLDIFLGTLGLLFTIIMLVFSLRPLVFLITVKRNNLINDDSNNNVNNVPDGTNKQPTKRRATGYPGKINFQIKRQESI